MISIVLEKKLLPKESEAFAKEFPNFMIHVIPKLEPALKSLSPLIKNAIQIYVGDHFPWEHAKEFPQLKWVHTHTSHLPSHPAPLIITSSQQVHAYEISQLLWSAFQYFSMKIPEIRTEDLDPSRKIWSAQNKTFLQIGLGPTGSHLAKMAKMHQMKTWGIQTKGSYHPACTKTFSNLSLHALLPHTDIISISPQITGESLEVFDEHTISLIKDDSILIIGGLGIHEVIPEKVFKRVDWSRFRGLITFSPSGISQSYADRIKALPNALMIPPAIIEHLEIRPSDSYRQFRNNLRAFSRNDMMGMQGVIQKGPLRGVSK